MQHAAASGGEGGGDDDVVASSSSSDFEEEPQPGAKRHKPSAPSFVTLQAAQAHVIAEAKKGGYVLKRLQKGHGTKGTMAVFVCNADCPVDKVVYRVKMPKGAKEKVFLVEALSEHTCRQAVSAAVGESAAVADGAGSGCGR